MGRMIEPTAPWNDHISSLAATIAALAPPPTRESWAKADVRWAQIRSLQFQLAVEFGHRHGWLLTDKEFSLRTLARNGICDDGTGLETAAALNVIDHPFWYRSNRRARALAVHLYNATGRHSDIMAWAAFNDLRASFPDFPSWWYPGWTTLVVYEPAGSRSICSPSQQNAGTQRKAIHTVA